MSLAELGFEHALILPESTDVLIENNPELGAFLNDLDRPIGIIKPDQAARFVVAAELTPAHYDVMESLAIAACMPSGRIFKDSRAVLKTDFTEFGDRVFSIVKNYRVESPRSHRVKALISVMGSFLVGHSHVDVDILHRSDNPNSIQRVEPLNQLELDEFSAIDHRVRRLVA